MKLFGKLLSVVGILGYVCALVGSVMHLMSISYFNGLDYLLALVVSLSVAAIGDGTVKCSE